MNTQRFNALTSRYPNLRVAVAGDFCLDRYLEIDPARQEISIETALPVHNIVRVRSQPGGAGTILNNLVALGVGAIHPVSLAGRDGEGYELRRALAAKRGVVMKHFVMSAQRQTFTYTKPMIMEPGQPPRELSRLDRKNWSLTPGSLQTKLIASLRQLAPALDALIVLDQVDVPDTGVVTPRLLETLAELSVAYPQLLILADSRRGLAAYPAVCLKMNRAELRTLTGESPSSLDQLKQTVAALADKKQRPVFVTLAEDGMMGAMPGAPAEYLPAWPKRGEIDIVGAGDAVTANLAAALAAGGNLGEALETANAAASIVIHQLGTTGTATVGQIRDLLAPS